MVMNQRRSPDHPERFAYYRCSSQLAAHRPNPAERCRAKLVRAAWLEDEVWQHCRRFILNPQDTLGEVQRELRARTTRTAELEAQRQSLQRQLGEKEAERERVLTLYRRNRISVSEAETQLDAMA